MRPLFGATYIAANTRNAPPCPSTDMSLRGPHCRQRRSRVRGEAQEAELVHPLGAGQVLAAARLVDVGVAVGRRLGRCADEGLARGRQGRPRRARGVDVGARAAGFFCLFNHYSHATYLDHGEIMYSLFPVRCPRSGGTLQAPLCPPPRPVPRKCVAHQRNDKGKGKRKREREETNGTA